MRVLLSLVVAILPAAAQSPLVRMLNVTHPFSQNFEIGDRFEITINGAPNQPVSVRTTMHGRTDWSPIVGSTDSTGRWSAAGQFDKNDFGSWREIWTVGGKLASPAPEFWVNAPCLPGGQGFLENFGMNMILTCETAKGRQTFATPSGSDPFRTPDGRLVPGRPNQRTPEQYHTEILQDLLGSVKEPAHVAPGSSRGGLGDETADLISKLVGVNALSESETRNALALIRGAFEKPDSISPSARDPRRTLLFLQHLAELSDQDSLKRQIAETIAYVRGQQLP
jgi:hypothetical protein